MKAKKRFKILFVTCGTRISPATRYRVYHILPFLNKENIDCTVYSIFSEKTTAWMINSSGFNPFKKMMYYTRLLIERFLRSWMVIFKAGGFDIVFLQRATFPLGMERLLKAKARNILFDIDDSIYRPDKDEKGPIGWIKGYIKRNEVVSALRASRCAIVENSHLGKFAGQYCGKVYTIGGPINTVRNFPGNKKAHAGRVVIGWIGSPSTALYLRMLDAVFKKLSNRYDIKVRLVGVGPYSLDGVDVESVIWSEETEVSELHKFDIGVMPMPDNEWTRGKLGCKMLQYMANGIPSVVSYTPTTAEVIEDGVNGFMATTDKEWIEKLSLLIERPDIREGIGRAARKTVEERFSLQTCVPIYLKIFRSCIK